MFDIAAIPYHAPIQEGGLYNTIVIGFPLRLLKKRANMIFIQYNKKIINGCLSILNFSFCIQLKILLVHCYHSWDIKLKTWREIRYVLALINFYNFIQRYMCIVLSDNLRELVLFVVKHS